MTLSPRRDLKITASDAPTICCGNEAQRLELFLQKVGEKERPPPTFAMRLGTYVEPWMTDEVEQQLQAELTERQRFVEHPSIHWLGCTLDSYCDALLAVCEMKNLSPHWRDDGDRGFINWYAPQVVVQMMCRGVSRGMLCVLQGTGPIALHEIETTPEYQSDVLARLIKFRENLMSMEPPSPMPLLVAPEKWRSVNLDNEDDVRAHNWSGAMMNTLRGWDATKDAFDQHELAKEDIKALLPADVGRVMFENKTVRRSRNNAVSTRRDK